MQSLRTFAVVLGFLQVSATYNDIDFKCDNEVKRVGFFQGKAEKGKRGWRFLCQDLLNQDSIKSHECYLGKLMKCDGSKEGCGANEWVNGFQITDVGASVAMLAPLCCKSPSVELSDCEKPAVVNPKGGNFVYKTTANKIPILQGCTLETDKDKKVKDIKFNLTACQYKVEGEIPKYDDKAYH